MSKTVILEREGVMEQTTDSFTELLPTWKTKREIGKRKGRSMEIERLIGRSLRAVCDLNRLGEYTITCDCDVIQADGGTRTASITGAWVALHDALDSMLERDLIKRHPLTGQVAAISMGLVNDD